MIAKYVLTSSLRNEKFHLLRPDTVTHTELKCQYFRYGVLRAIEGLATHDDILQDEAIGGWYERVKGAVGSSANQGHAEVDQ